MIIEVGTGKGVTLKTDKAPSKCCKNSNKSSKEESKGGIPLPAKGVKEGFQEEAGEGRSTVLQA